MKKLFLSAMALVAATTMSVAQEIDFGVQAGVNFAKLQGDSVEDADGRTGINVGLTGEYMFNDSFALFTGVIYSQQGLQSEDAGIEQKLKLDYLNVPVLAKFYIADSGFSIDAGPQIGFIVNDEYTVEGGPLAGETDLDAATIDLSAGGGVSYKFLEGTTLEGLSIGARYMIGLSNIYDDDEAFGDDLTNSVLSVNLGYRF
ncbi:hypothetical protein BST97_00715 [Nonlabens spongiae]|uniref:Outer membrane protein beta-barrel domain-containing protein n=1 Tax=Nonlabens spongiae TaxID=331648 RepID=A0A1W6MGE2_9FLAO|nr:porin family protein [Nonlabens spongiae]ARN76642.1 hypothetical protein BST97_00715 [Nonlabens spongiae]